MYSLAARVTKGSAYIPSAQVPKTYWPHGFATVGSGPSADNGRFCPRKKERKRTKEKTKNKEKRTKNKEKRTKNVFYRIAGREGTYIHGRSCMNIHVGGYCEHVCTFVPFLPTGFLGGGEEGAGWAYLNVYASPVRPIQLAANTL